MHSITDREEPTPLCKTVGGDSTCSEAEFLEKGVVKCFVVCTVGPAHFTCVQLYVRDRVGLRPSPAVCYCSHLTVYGHPSGY